MRYLLNKPPTRAHIATVLACIVFLEYSWSILFFLYEVPAWLKFLHGDEVLVLFCYTLAGNLIESLFVLSLLWIASMVLPLEDFRHRFDLWGSLISVAAFLPLMVYWTVVFPRYIYFSLLFVLLSVSLLTFLTTRTPWFAGLLLRSVERLKGFLYIYVPLSLVALVVVLFRNGR